LIAKIIGNEVRHQMLASIPASILKQSPSKNGNPNNCLCCGWWRSPACHCHRSQRC